jgi:6-pyruvoyltetrahydropterin/6-carboxytetrahydropterin synthase
MITANRYHDISCGHRVVGHKSKCRFLHGHNYRFHFEVEPWPANGVYIPRSDDGLDDLGMVMDFGVIKKYLCDWLEANYDHKFLVWDKDPLISMLKIASPESLYIVTFNPTAENIAKNFVLEIAPALLAGTGVRLRKLTLEETRKCSATYEL